jgi:hypothetical protein
MTRNDGNDDALTEFCMLRCRVDVKQHFVFTAEESAKKEPLPTRVSAYRYPKLSIELG